jgi:lysyl-tRNA synthetase class 2
MAKVLDELMANRLARLEKLEGRGRIGFPNDFRPKHRLSELNETYREWDGQRLEETPQAVAVAGRVMTLRSMGKATFLHMKDRDDQLQVYVKKDVIGEDAYEDFQAVEVGDIIGVQGTLMRTRTGELTVATREVVLLTKALRPLPEKFHGLQDIETRYRQRYVDLIMNDPVRRLFLLRSRIVQFIRRYLDGRDFLEVETPMMHPIPGGAAARPFITHHNAQDMDLYLRIAPELYLKRLLVGGLERVYEINRNFRNEGISYKHNPEFTMLEFYWAYADFEDLMELTEDLVSRLFTEVLGKSSISIDGKDISVARPWRRVSLKDSLSVIGGFPAEHVEDPEYIRSWLTRRGVEVKPDWGIGKLQVEVYDQVVESAIVEPTFIIHHPVEVSPLSRRNRDNPEVVDRFELIVAGREIANAFSELNDPRDQRCRFEEQAKARAAGDDEAHQVDEDFLRALEYGMPPAAGEGIGIDRLVMLACGVDNIKEVILFPLMRHSEEDLSRT